MARNSLMLAIAQSQQTKDLGQNLREIANFIGKAAEAEADIVAFPECALTGYGPAYHESSADFDPDAVEAAVEEVLDLAREAKIAVILGAHLPTTTEIEPDAAQVGKSKSALTRISRKRKEAQDSTDDLRGTTGAGWTNSSLAISKTGKLLTRYDKIQLYGLEPEFYRAGLKRPAVVKPAGAAKMGLQICFDLRFPEPFRFLAREGAGIIFVPSHIHGEKDMWKGPVIEGHIRSRAAENGRFVVFINAAGPEQNAPSLVADPSGRLVAIADMAEPQLLLAHLNISEVNNDFLQTLRTDLY